MVLSNKISHNFHIAQLPQGCSELRSDYDFYGVQSPHGLFVLILHSVGKGAPRPLNFDYGDFSRAINPSSHSLLAQRMGEERHSLKRREGLFRASDR